MPARGRDVIYGQPVKVTYNAFPCLIGQKLFFGGNADDQIRHRLADLFGTHCLVERPGKEYLKMTSYFQLLVQSDHQNDVTRILRLMCSCHKIFDTPPCNMTFST